MRIRMYPADPALDSGKVLDNLGEGFPDTLGEVFDWGEVLHNMGDTLCIRMYPADQALDSGKVWIG